MICHGLTLIWGGFASFAFHAGYLHMGHYIDIATVFSMTSYPAFYAIFNLFLEDLNRCCRIGHIVSKLAAIICFLINLWLGFLFKAKRGEWEIKTEIFLLTFVAITVIGIILKALKEWILGRSFRINVGWLIIGFLSIGVGAFCQESIVK